jgi:hypothetical protein
MNSVNFLSPKNLHPAHLNRWFFQIQEAIIIF